MNHVYRIGPSDLERERRFVRRLGARTKRLRVLGALGEPSEAQLLRLVSPDPEREMALAWVDEQPGEFAAVARFARLDREHNLAEFAIVVADDCQGQGIGRGLLLALMSASREAGLCALEGDTYADNKPLLGLCRELGFNASSHPDDSALTRLRVNLR
jgi:acetyltransferase